jgi:hypothetical protein
MKPYTNATARTLEHAPSEVKGYALRSEHDMTTNMLRLRQHDISTGQFAQRETAHLH